MTVTGFLLTAVPNWTGRLPLQGLPLAGLAALWLVGRVAARSRHGRGGLPALVDLAFPVALLAAAGREILAGRNWRNLPVCWRSGRPADDRADAPRAIGLVGPDRRAGWPWPSLSRWSA